MSDQLFDHAVRDWLEDGSDRTPPTAVDAVLLAVKTTPQERDLRIPRRFTLMPTYMRLAAGIAIVAVLGVAGLTLIKPNTGPGATPSPAPTATAAAVSPTHPPRAGDATNLDTKTWTPFTSTRYGYTAAYPALSGWFLAVATQDWVFETREQFWSSAADGADRIVSPGAFWHLTAFSSTVAAQTTPEGWIDSYINMGPACPSARDLPVIEIDGHQGRISTNCAFAKTGPQPSPVVEAFVTVGQTMFVFGIDDYDDALLRTFLTTVKLPAA